MNAKSTLVLGASLKPERYSYRAMRSLAEYGHPVFAIGNRAGETGGIIIHTGKPDLKNIHTVTLYLSAENQEPLCDYILSLKPERIIFNPGAENPVLMKRASLLGIKVLEACTLTMLSIGNY